MLYRLEAESLAIRTSKGDRSTTTIPAGELVEVLDGPVGTKRLVEVNWNGETLLMFADDLEHGETSFFSRARTASRAANVNLSPTGLERREQALIEHLIWLTEANQELERFAFGAAHDLREPLRSILAMTQLVLERNQGKLDAESSKMLGFVVSGAQRMRVLIQDLLDFAVASNRAEPTKVDVRQIVELATQNLSQAIQETGARIEVQSLPEIRGNADELLRLFQNLICNAIKYRSRNTPVIQISASEHGDVWTFSVSDNGVGIDPKYHDQIFAPFRRVRRTADHDGSGVGLAICKRIVDGNGGRIWVESEAGHGSKFCFTLPASADHVSRKRAHGDHPKTRTAAK